MHANSLLSLLIGAIIICTILVSGLALFFLTRSIVASRKLPKWLTWASVPIGLLIGIFIAFFVIFSDLGPSFIYAKTAPVFEVVVPEKHNGFVELFFDPKFPPLTPAEDNLYRLNTLANGNYIGGVFPKLHQKMPYADFKLRYPDGSIPKTAGHAPYVDLGNFNGVWHVRFFIGSQSEYEAIYQQRIDDGTYWNEQEIYKELRK